MISLPQILRLTSILTIGFGLGIASQASAQTTVALYTFSDGESTNLADLDLQSFDSSSNTTAGSISSFDTGATNPNGYSVSTAGGPPISSFVRSVNVTTSEAGAVTNNDYFSFTVTPNSGYQISFTSLTFSMASSHLQGDAQFTGYVFLRSSTDSYDSNLGSTYSQQSPGSSVGNIDWTDNNTITISGLDEITEATTFHLYVYSSDDLSTQIIRLDNISLQGTVVAVPEASETAAIFAVFTVGLVFWIRRRKR